MSKETSRERILKTINHQQPDGLAIDFASSTSTGISIFAYTKLRDYLKVDQDQLPKLYDLFLMLADPSNAVLDLMGGDIIQLKRYSLYFDIALKDWKPWKFSNGTECLVPGGFNPTETDCGLEIKNPDGKVIAKMPKDGFYFDQTDFPYMGIDKAEEIDELGLAGISDAELAYLQKESKRLHVETDKAVMFPIYARTFEAGIRNWGFEEFLVQLMTNRDMVHHYFEILTDIYINDLDRILSTCNEYIDILRFCDDLGSQDSLLMSPEIYREMIKPYHTKMFRFIKQKYPKQKIALHCCGSIKPLIPDLIESGVEILNPVQISAANMNPVDLKKEFGNDIVFWGGGADMQSRVMNGTIEGRAHRPPWSFPVRADRPGLNCRNCQARKDP